MPELTQQSSVSPTRIKVFGSATGRLRSRTAFTSVKIAALAPIPRARVRTAVAVNPGVFLSCRSAYRMSCISVATILFSSRAELALGNQVGSARWLGIRRSRRPILRGLIFKWGRSALETGSSWLANLPALQLIIFLSITNSERRGDCPLAIPDVQNRTPFALVTNFLVTKRLVARLIVRERL